MDINKTKVYACYSKNQSSQLNGSSGGCYFHLARDFIVNGGVVYSACYSNTNIVHKRINSLENVTDGCGAKYCPSDLQNTFEMIQIDLNNNLNVLFFGTPCQCAGLKSLSKKDSQLYLVDFVCHGVPSKRVYNKFIMDREEKYGKIKSINMRDKKQNGWRNYNFTIMYENGFSESIPHLQVPFIKGMLNDLYLRPSCYSCCFKGFNRKSDITLGDCWGVESFSPEMDNNNGVSLIILHNTKGLVLFDRIKHDLFYKELKTDDYIKCNPYFVESASGFDKRISFFKQFEKTHDLQETVEKMTKKNILKRFARAIKRKMQI